MSKVEKKETGSPAALNRRELLTKYGAYTAPIVVSMLDPQKAYAENGSTIYSSLQTCLDNHMLNRMGRPKINHCNSMH